MARPTPRELEVLHSTHVTPHMLRITLGGSALADFPAGQESAYIKLMFPQPGEERPLVRTYTVRQQGPDSIDVDFALHDAFSPQTQGPASSWAANAQPGDRILVGGPGPRKLVNPEGDWFLIAGDMTALPAISVNLALLPADARGYAVIEVVDAADIQPLAHPENLELVWVVNPQANAGVHPLLDSIKALRWLDGNPAVWAACEFNSMRAMRKYFKQQRQIPKSHLYISSYWKIGSSESQHKVAKKQDEQQEQ
ncbi:siderophore-interacting protein [Aestuariicella hydrocarbonica]|uniref:Siderophore-interacting protein n=1 Tax=Pseudomaricurvus hydrocarbonicus TaxID=1470433 RepID=A0A9E5JXD6_9GAMM|nr:siderophore-interacting protein [Aestuariicella hydrocarbonica]NHO66270.1 siderophore-interacting protein [Aestuariicella hydrocarbonica]